MSRKKTALQRAAPILPVSMLPPTRTSVSTAAYLDPESEQMLAGNVPTLAADRRE